MKYDTVRKVIDEIGVNRGIEDLLCFIIENYYDVTGEVIGSRSLIFENEKIIDLVSFYKFDVEEWIECVYADGMEGVFEWIMIVRNAVCGNKKLGLGNFMIVVVIWRRRKKNDGEGVS